MSAESKSNTSIQSFAQRLTSIASHVGSSTGLPKVVIARDLGPDVMPLLLNRKDIQVRKGQYNELHRMNADYPPGCRLA